MDSVSEEYRTYLFPEIIRLHQVNQVNLDIREYLKRINPSMLNQSARKYMVELLVDRHAYREAYAWLQRYGIEEIDAVRLAAVAGSMAGKRSMQTKNSWYIFVQKPFLVENMTKLS